MAFDLSTARPVQPEQGGFDLSTAKPVPTTPAVTFPDGVVKITSLEDQGLARSDSGEITQKIGPRTFAEPALAAVTGGVADIAGGLKGLVAAPFVGSDRAANIVRETQEARTFVPRPGQGQAGQEAAGGAIVGALDAVNQFGRDIGVPEWMLKPIGDLAFEETGSPAAATLAVTLTTALFEFLALKGVQRIKPGKRLLTPDGRPTLLLEKTLDKQGLVYDNLSDAAKAKIPEVAPKNIIPGGKEVAGPSELVLVEQIKSGAKDNSLAGLRVFNDKVVPDVSGMEAIRQGFDDGFVQAVKTASAESKAAMRKMLNITRRISKNSRLALDIRPTEVVGEALSKRIKFIRDKANAARNELNIIANTKLRGKSVDGSPVVAQLEESLAKLNIQLIDGAGGVPTPVFKGSQISKDRVAQKAIKEVIELMAEGGTPDALRFHELKLQLDNMIDFKKKSAGGLSDAGRKVLKDIRSSLNQAVRGVSDDYARVNDVLSSSLTALDDFEKVSGSSIDIFGEGSSAAIGQDARGLMSNRKSRVKLENAINQLNQVASDLGATFGDDIKDLALFANSIEDRFGAIAQTSFKGEIESAVNRAGQQSVTSAALQAGVEKIAKGAEKLRGINDLNAFRAMSDVLNQ